MMVHYIFTSSLLFASENLFMSQADAAVQHGFRDAGYTIIAMDDCWLEKERDQNGKLIGDLNRFPSGMKALADYVSDKDN